jgi:hypothetical protein
VDHLFLNPLKPNTLSNYSIFQSVLFIAFSLLVSACGQKEDGVPIPAECASKATFYSIRGLGCGYILLMQNGQSEEALEPVNLEEFELEPANGMVVCIEFVDATDAASICMAGRLIELQSIVQVEE